MCGIVGIWNQSDEDISIKMAQSVAHRGPDGINWLTISSSSLGASRLAIKGDPHASAIFCDAETNVAVMLNGEIYNIEALRQDLAAAGCVFHTDLESEVISELYKREGLDFATHLKGMFAIAILDGDQLVLARDRFGIKPMYYANIGRRVLFGSEIKAILKHPEFEAKLYLPSLEEISVFGYIYSLNKTLFESITQVEPGTVVVFSEGRQDSKKFWQAPQARYLMDQEHCLDFSTAVTQLRKLIIETMDLLLSHGEQPMGICLSGGLDSTILTLVARNILGYPVITFTLADSSETADLVAAREVARKLGTKHIEWRVTVDDYFDSLNHFVRHYEAFDADGVFDVHGNVAFHLLSKTISDYVKVALTGDGADELFGGYYWIHAHPLGFADRIRYRFKQLGVDGGGIRKVVDDLFPSPEDEHIYRRNVFDALIRGGLANYHLQSVDRSAGAYGFEVRPGYLFDDLAAFALDLPIEFKVPSKQVTKWILREAFKPELEHSGLDWVPNRLKEGMPTAVSSLAPIINQRIEDSISDSSLTRHPFKKYLRSKFDMYLFDIFAETFLPEAIYVIQDCTTQ